jgi:nicotinamidase-related amidase
VPGHEIDPEFDASALVIIDTQRDLLDDGALTVPGTSAALPAMRRLLDAFRAAERPIVHIVRIYEQDGSNADLCRRELLRDGAPILIRDSEGTQIAPELLPDPAAELDANLLLGGGVQHLGPGEVAIFKPRWGAFYRTPLEHHLHALEVSTIVFAGCNFPNCPRTSIYEASERDFRIVLVRDAISGLYARGEQELAGIGVRLMDASEVEASLRAPVGSS